MDDHSALESHSCDVIQGGGARGYAKPSEVPPRRKKHTGQLPNDTHETNAGEGRASSNSIPIRPTPAPKNSVGHPSLETHMAIANGADQANEPLNPIWATPDPQKSPQGARTANPSTKPNEATPCAKDGGHEGLDTQNMNAPTVDETGQGHIESQLTDARFVDPLIQQIVEQWRQRQDMVRAMTRLTLQSKSILRRLVNEDDLKKQKAKANALFARVVKYQALGERLSLLDPEKEKPRAKIIAKLAEVRDHPEFDKAQTVVGPLLAALKPLDEYRKPLEKNLEQMAAELPIAHMVEQTRGFGYLGLASIVAECGDLSDYRSVAAVWKRMGLAVIDGKRQRRVKGDEALRHGYDAQKRSIIWTITDSLFKAQSAGIKDGAEPGPYRADYDKYKAAELAKELTPGHAHNRALRKVSKDLLRDLTIAWRADRATPMPKPLKMAPDPQISLIEAA